MSLWNRIRYSLYAPFYDLVVEQAGVLQRGRRRSLELAALAPGEAVLLVAAGTGLDLEHVPAGVRLAAVDVTPAMVRRLRRRARALGRPVAAQVADAARLPFRDGAFDCVVLHLALAVVPDPVGAMREAARVLAPGGRIAIFDKFLPDGAVPSAARRVASAIARVLATDLNVRLGPVVNAAGLTLTRREPAGLKGLFVVARAERGARERSPPDA